MNKKIIISVLSVVILVGMLFILTGCGSKKEKKVEGVEISHTMGKGNFTVTVPKNEDGSAKYQFTTEKPDGVAKSSTFYLVTDTAIFGFSSSGLTYNTSSAYKEKYGETEATFDGYLALVNDTENSSRPKLAGMEELELNGRKALRYYNRSGSSSNYSYYGYNYMIAADEIYKGSNVNMIVNYKDETKPTEAKEFDQETLDIISSLKITLNK